MYYTVWGIIPGIYENWEDCKKNVISLKVQFIKNLAI